MKWLLSVAIVVMVSLVGIVGVNRVAGVDHPELVTPGQKENYIVNKVDDINNTLNNLVNTVNNLIQNANNAMPLWSQTLPASTRFELVLGGEGVLDKETGLVWEKSPSTNTFNWFDALSHCNALTVGNRMGWRLPTLQELASLVDPSVLGTSPTLPAGHPFSSNVKPSNYWSASTFAFTPILAWSVNFNAGLVDEVGKSNFLYFTWCVRGGQGVDPQ
jgi:hypothetical protein